MRNSGANCRVDRVLGYRRVAALTQGPPIESSIEAQKTAIEEYCKAHELPTPVHRARIGSGLDCNDELARLVDEVRAGDAVIVRSLDRLSRDGAAVVAFIRAIQAKQALFIAITDDFDTRRPEAERILTLLAHEGDA